MRSYTEHPLNLISRRSFLLPCNRRTAPNNDQVRVLLLTTQLSLSHTHTHCVTSIRQVCRYQKETGVRKRTGIVVLRFQATRKTGAGLLQDFFDIRKRTGIVVFHFQATRRTGAGSQQNCVGVRNRTSIVVFSASYATFCSKRSAYGTSSPLCVSAEIADLCGNLSLHTAKRDEHHADGGVAALTSWA